ncbi:MAG: hypothetical protein H0X51_09470 [Parachlamydiaceae bacterium]|nr:hypothetical protein [Parachlamydiaceae bacterium]
MPEMKPVSYVGAIRLDNLGIDAMHSGLKLNILSIPQKTDGLITFVKSVLFGSDGNYHAFGIDIQYKQNELGSNSDLGGAGCISVIANRCFNSHVFHVVTQGYLHTFIHEVGHALAGKVLYGENSRIIICTSPIHPVNRRDESRFKNWKETIYCLSGPLANMCFSTCKLVAAVAFRSYLSLPVACIFGAGAVFWISGELLYAYVSAAGNLPEGDFYKIARIGNVHLALSTVVLVGQAALGVFCAVQFL